MIWATREANEQGRSYWLGGCVCQTHCSRACHEPGSMPSWDDYLGRPAAHTGVDLPCDHPIKSLVISSIKLYSPSQYVIKWRCEVSMSDIKRKSELEQILSGWLILINVRQARPALSSELADINTFQLNASLPLKFQIWPSCLILGQTGLQHFDWLAWVIAAHCPGQGMRDCLC